jgi:hypothetical protein
LFEWTGASGQGEDEDDAANVDPNLDVAEVLAECTVWKHELIWLPDAYLAVEVDWGAE